MNLKRSAKPSKIELYSYNEPYLTCAPMNHLATRNKLGRSNMNFDEKGEALRAMASWFKYFGHEIR